MAEYMTDKAVSDGYRSQAQERYSGLKARTLGLLLKKLGRLAWDNKRERIRRQAFYEVLADLIIDVMIRMRIDEYLVPPMILLQLEWRMKTYKDDEVGPVLEVLFEAFGYRRTWEMVEVEIVRTTSESYVFTIDDELHPNQEWGIPRAPQTRMVLDALERAFGTQLAYRHIAKKYVIPHVDLNVTLRIKRGVYTKLSPTDRRKLHRVLHIRPTLKVVPRTDRFMSGRRRKGWPA